MDYVTKRNGQRVPFDISKIVSACRKAFDACGCKMPASFEELLTENTAWFVAAGEVEKIQDHIEDLLFKSGYQQVFKAFASYRANRALLRENRIKEAFEGIMNLDKNDVTNDNANMNAATPSGQMMKYASESTKAFTKKYLLSKPVLEAMEDNIIYPHDLDFMITRGLNCLQLPLDKILQHGFSAGHGEARPAKRIETAATLAAIALQTTQNEMFGGQSIPAFDFYMAPYVRATYVEEVNKIRDLLVDGEASGFWDAIRDAEINDYITKDLPHNSMPTYGNSGINKERIQQMAINQTVRRVHQAMEGLLHNLNSMHSRGGNQVVFSSLNYGTDTSAEGRCVMRELLKATEQGVGNNATAIFPIQIWKCKKGVSIDPGDRNYDLFKMACKVSARRFFPNFLNLDSSINTDPLWKADDPKRYIHEVATMG